VREKERKKNRIKRTRKAVKTNKMTAVEVARRGAKGAAAGRL